MGGESLSPVRLGFALRRDGRRRTRLDTGNPTLALVAFGDVFLTWGGCYLE